MASARYLNEDGSFNRSAILKAAHNIARSDVQRAESKGRKRRYAVALRDALRLHVWVSAQVEREMTKRDAELAAMPVAQSRAALALRAEAFCARAIDSLPAHLAAMASISARAAALGVTL